MVEEDPHAVAAGFRRLYFRQIPNQSNRGGAGRKSASSCSSRRSLDARSVTEGVRGRLGPGLVASERLAVTMESVQAILRGPGPKLLVLATALAAAVGAAVLLYGFRLELFVLPWKLRRILELKQQVSELNEMNAGDRSDQQEVLRSRIEKELRRALEEIILAQRPDFGLIRWPDIVDVKTHEGVTAYVLLYWGEEQGLELKTESYLAGKHLMALDSRGRIFGCDFLAPPWPGAICFGQGSWKTDRELVDHDVIAVAGDVGYGFSVDSSGIVPRGAVAQFAFGGPPDLRAGRLSTGTSQELRRWLRTYHSNLAGLSAIESLLASPRIGDIFRALHEIEKIGSTASHLARPLLQHPDPELRARAASVLGNNERLHAGLVPLLEDPSTLVQTSARLALLNATDVAMARGAFLDLLRGQYDGLGYLDFDFDRLRSPDVAAALLQEIKKHGHADEPFWSALRTEDLRPLVPQFEELWGSRAPRRFDRGTAALEIIPSMVRLEDPRLDRLLLDLMKATIDDSDEDWFTPDPVVEICKPLLRRESPLHGGDALQILVRRADSAVSASRGIATHLVLIHWKLPEAREKFLSRLRRTDAIEGDWLRWVADFRHYPVATALLPDLRELAAADPTSNSEPLRRLDEWVKESDAGVEVGRQ